LSKGEKDLGKALRKLAKKTWFKGESTWKAHPLAENVNSKQKTSEYF